MHDIFTLSNGLRVVIEKIEYVNSVSFGLWVENGSRNENPTNNGISHFIEHMLFKGTHNRSAKDIAEAIENVGGQLNAFTSKETTCFYAKTLYNHLELSMDVISDMLFHSKLDEEDIEKEKGVVIEEINMNEDSPEDVLGDLHSKAIWGEDPISYPVLGTIDTVKSFHKKELREYINQYYIPENSVISICGKIDIIETKKLIEKFFGHWNSSQKKITCYSCPNILKNNFLKEKPIEQVHISLGMKGIALGDDDLYPMLLVNNVFGGGVASKLFQKVREELGLCYTIYSYNSSFNKTGTLNIYTGVSPQYVNLALEAINNEISEFCHKEIYDIDLDVSKEQLKGFYILGAESVSSKMFANGKSVLFLNKIITPKDMIEKIDNITMENVLQVMNRTFKHGILNSAFVGNHIDINKINDIISI